MIMKTFKQISLLCLFWMIGMSVSAYDFAAKNEDGVTIYYNITSRTSPKTVEVDQTSKATTINFPSTVTYNNITYGVTSIRQYAFKENTTIRSITLPKYLTQIQEQQFFGCTNLQSVTIGNSVTSIGNYAFRECSGLTSVTIGNSVTSIGSYAFYECSGLTSITIPNSVTSIGYMAFMYCSLTSVTIPNSVKSIGDYAFFGCSLTSLTIPNSVMKIGSYTFSRGNLESITVEDGNTCYDSREECNAIIEKSSNRLIVGCKNTIIPNSVTSIGSNAFMRCSGLTSITIPNSVTSIGFDAFYQCSGLTSVTIPNSVTSIGNYAFYGCSGLTSITIPNSVTSIEEGAFDGCSGLTSIAIPNSVTSIGERAFKGCSGLNSITISTPIPNFSEKAFEGLSLSNVNINLNSWQYENIAATIPELSNAAFHYYYNGSKLSINYKFPDDVTTLPNYALYNCKDISSVEIPSNITTIGSSAFTGCSRLSSATVYFDYWDQNNIAATIPVLRNCSFHYYFNGNKIDENFKFPNNITQVPDYRFLSCADIQWLVIPTSITQIGYNAFNKLNVIFTSAKSPTLAEYIGGNVYYPKTWINPEISAARIQAYTVMTENADGSFAFDNPKPEDWNEYEIPDDCKWYFVPAKVNAYFYSNNYIRTFNNHEWQSWYIPADVPYSSLSANFEVAKFSDTQVSANEIEIESVTSGTLTANTPYLVRLKDDKATGEYSIVADESAGLKETVENEVNIGSNYKLKTTYRELSGEELKGKYALSEGKFKKAGDSATLKPFRVYLEPVTTGAADVLDLVMDGTTDITLTPSSVNGAETIYNLNGQAVGEDYKGVVIKNGKKVFKN